MKRSPNLFLIGAMKAGTTSLHNYLGSHPDIFMTAEKEPTHFVDRAQLRRHWPEKEVRGYWKEAKYARLFQSARDEKIVGESSIGYALMPMFDGVAQRIKECCPDAKILYVVRHPLERAISHYWWEVNAAREATPIEKALHPESIYLKASDYAYQLADYMTYFRMENVKIVTTETLKRRPESVMSDIFSWLGVDSAFVPSNICDKYNRSSNKLYVYPGWVVASGVLSLPPVVMIRNAGPSWAKNAFKKVARVRTLEPMKCDTSTFRARFGALVEGQIDKLSRLTEESKFAEWAAEGRRGIVG